MRVPRSKDTFTILLTGLLILFGPVVILAGTITFLTFAQGYDSSEISTVELVELYVLELVLVVVFGYVVYRLTLYMVEQRLPGSLTAIERQSQDAEDRRKP